eukprot:gene8395-9975_t
MSLVIPLTAWLIEHELKPSVDIVTDVGPVKHSELLPDIQKARVALYEDFNGRWVLELDESIVEDYCALVSQHIWTRVGRSGTLRAAGSSANGTMTCDKALKYLRGLESRLETQDKCTCGNGICLCLC